MHKPLFSIVDQKEEENEGKKEKEKRHPKLNSSDHEQIFACLFEMLSFSRSHSL